MFKILLFLFLGAIGLFVGAIVVVGLYDGFHGVNRFEQNRQKEQGSVNAIENMTGREFEVYCAGILKRNDFHDIEMTPTTGDQGVDIIAYRNGFKYAVQCKKYSSSVGNKSVQEVISGMTYYSCDAGLVMTNSYFTKSAIALAEKANVALIDGEDIREFENNKLI